MLPQLLESRRCTPQQMPNTIRLDCFSLIGTADTFDGADVAVFGGAGVRQKEKTKPLNLVARPRKRVCSIHLLLLLLLLVVLLLLLHAHSFGRIVVVAHLLGMMLWLHVLLLVQEKCTKLWQTVKFLQYH